MVALGEIQKHLGPDTRFLLLPIFLMKELSSNDQFIPKKLQIKVIRDGIDLNEDNQFNKIPFGQRYWTGVWKNRAKSKGGVHPGD